MIHGEMAMLITVETPSGEPKWVNVRDLVAAP